MLGALPGGLGGSLTCFTLKKDLAAETLGGENNGALLAEYLSLVEKSNHLPCGVTGTLLVTVISTGGSGVVGV